MTPASSRADNPAADLVIVGLIGYLLIHLVSLIRDLDNLFEYAHGKPGAGSGRGERRPAGCHRRRAHEPPI